MYTLGIHPSVFPNNKWCVN